MRKNFGAKPWMYPQPVLMIASYCEDGSADVMNAAWGGIADYKRVSIYVSKAHKTVENILREKAFTVSMADAKHVVEADYVGLVSANTVSNKLEQANLHAVKSSFVNAPIIDEFPMTIECNLIEYDEKNEHLVGEIINVSAKQSILDEQGNIDPKKLAPITFDAVHNAYLVLGEKVGNAFQDGKKLK